MRSNSIVGVCHMLTRCPRLTLNQLRRISHCLILRFLSLLLFLIIIGNPLPMPEKGGRAASACDNDVLVPSFAARRQSTKMLGANHCPHHSISDPLPGLPVVLHSIAHAPFFQFDSVISLVFTSALCQSMFKPSVDDDRSFLTCRCSRPQFLC